MPTYELTNPSDPYTIRGEFAPCAVAVLILGGGWFGLRPIDKGGREMPTGFALAGEARLADWLRAECGIDNYGAWLEANLEAVAEVLDTVIIGSPSDRLALEARLADARPDDRRRKLALWHDAKRTSLTDIGASACALAARLREIAAQAGGAG